MCVCGVVSFPNVWGACKTQCPSAENLFHQRTKEQYSWIPKVFLG
jgi:hypothetical protein